MKFYRMSANPASRLVSVCKLINGDEVKFFTCPLCGFSKLMKWEDFEPIFECETITKNRSLPDLMLYGGRYWYSIYDWIIVSKKFKEFFEENQFTKGIFSPIKLKYKRRNTFFEVEEKYYLMQITGKGELDYEKMGLMKKCEFCRKDISRGQCPMPSKGIYPALFDEASWDGSDIFNNSFCTGAFAKKVLEAGLTGLGFDELECYLESYCEHDFSFITNPKKIILE